MQNRSTLLEPDWTESRQVMETALGRAPADLAFVNASVLNVYTGEMLADCAVCTRGKWIAYVGDNPGPIIAETTQVVDARSRVLIPGLIEGHAHLAWLYSPAEFLRCAIAGGTTTLVTETMEIFPVAGYDGVIDFLNSLREQPIKILASAPALISISRTARSRDRQALFRLLARDDVLGLGESYWQAVLQGPDEILPLFQEARRLHKTLEGHSAGASGRKLAAYAAVGISSCHEPISAAEVLARLRLGLTVMIREGSIRRDLQAISAIKDSAVSLRRLTLTTDGVEPKDLIERGFMEYVVQKAIDCGFEPLSAIRMATLNVAEHFRIDHLVGGIAPGRYADMLLVPETSRIVPELVVSNGRIVAEAGRLLAAPRLHRFSAKSRNSVHLPRQLLPSDFSILTGAAAQVTVRVIELVTDLVTKEARETLAAAGGELRAEPARDLLKVAAVDRRHVPGRCFTGLIRGFGLADGAIAASGAWDSSDIVAVGARETDMAAAVNRIRELQGGAVVCCRGRILAEIALPLMGIISELPVKDLAVKVDALNASLRQLGVRLKNPLLTLVTLTGAAIPYLRICEEGLVNLKDGRTQGIFID